MMRRNTSKDLLLAVLAAPLLSIVGCGGGTAPTAAKPVGASCPPEAVEKVRAAIPVGWKLSVEGDRLLLRPPQPVKLIFMVSRPPGSKPEDCVVSDEYLVTLRFGPLVSPEDYRRLAAQNATTHKQMDALYEEMEKEHIIHKSEFWPVTPQHHKLVEDYKKLKASLHKLPAVCGKDFSVWISDSLTGSWLQFLRAEDKKMCSDVLDKVRALFTPYPQPKN
jgi:hypothetical protein